MKWIPKLGDVFPDFTAESTEGRIRFHEWAEGQWTFLFSHPGSFTPVCSTEMAGFAAAAPDFAARGVRLMTISGDPLERQVAWRKDIEEIFEVEIDFPSVADQSGVLSNAFGMIHPKQSEACPIRKSFVVDPALRVRMIFEYPRMIGRSTDETLRVIDALQASDRYNLGTPADWQPGDDMLCVPGRTVAENREIFGVQVCEVRDYLQVVPVREGWYRPAILMPMAG
ncbi:MAG: redoxin domain-containing protein [Rhodobacteraceae bacterium]|nr:redoxin domain-containing protein [Paracoccaceae bacterium]